MSSDPFASASDVPPPVDPTSMRQRVQTPAIALIVAGVLNLFLAAVPALQTLRMMYFSAAEVEEAAEKQNPQAREQLEQMKQMGWPMERVLRVATWIFAVWAVVDFLASFLVIFGGIRMLSLKSYGLVIFASVLAMLPFFSCTSCCGLGGIIGIWALVVLLNAEVRAAFH